MGPERKEELACDDPALRRQQEFEELLLTSKRLVAEMELLTARAKLLAEQQVAIVKSIAEKRGRK
jgi:primosomal protein N''